ncbi:MAG: hypothetical protein RLZZ26_420 [Candidatus Parcubacteria bacterium]|jgi:rfaE bifunctional protein nucleotidyltransferase chain/domain
MTKVSSFSEVLKAAQKAHREGKVIVATNGCFDLLHVGHIRYLEEAKKLGDLLIVGINSDSSVRENKGDLRPIVPAKERAEVIASLRAVDYAFIFSNRTPFSWIEKLRPDIHVKGGGADILVHPDLPAHQEAVRKAGGKMVLLKHHKGRSTSSLIQRVINSEKKQGA